MLIGGSAKVVLHVRISVGSSAPASMALPRVCARARVVGLRLRAHRNVVDLDQALPR